MLGALRRCGASIPRSLAVTSARSSIPRSQVARIVQTVQLQKSFQVRAFSSTIRWQQEALAEATETEQSSNGPIIKFQELADKQLIHRNVIDAITGSGMESMTEVQSATINQALKGTDIIAQARTGTGKTIAFLLPILQRILTNDPSLAERRGMKRTSASDIRALIISPTRELAEQIADEARKICRNTNIIVQAAVGGTMKSQMLRATQMQGCHIMVGTPGRLQDILGDPTSGIACPGLDVFVLDEADRLLDAGFWPDVQNILRLCPDPRQHDRQSLMFSATMPREVIRIAEEALKPGYEFVSTVDENEEPTIARVPQKVVRCENMENMMPAMYELAIRETKKAEETGGRPFKAIVFFNSTAEVSYATAVFSNLKRASQNGRAFLSRTPVIEIHSKLSQNQRTRASSDFKSLPGAMLFSSDVTARGMDFPNVTHVIQVGIPTSTEVYIHRLGRTARAGKEGEGWLMLNKMELPEARQRLRKLPLKPDETLHSAKVDMTSPAQLPAHVAGVLTDIGNAVKSVDPGLLSGLYRAYLGVYQWVPSKQILVDNLAQLTRYGWGLSTPPKIALGLANKLRLSGLRNINIGVEDRPRNDFGNRGGYGGGRGGYGGDRNDSERYNGGGDRGRGGFSRRTQGGYGGGGYSGGGGNRDRAPPAW